MVWTLPVQSVPGFMYVRSSISAFRCPFFLARRYAEPNFLKNPTCVHVIQVCRTAAAAVPMLNVERYNVKPQLPASKGG